ncbi:hypothetical protein BGW80DRAFT_1339669 [Lactifluus volemus]|nr:hypothetical protein BGW80DRAFT_1339669 [Lactifluus volemus]
MKSKKSGIPAWLLLLLSSLLLLLWLLSHVLYVTCTMYIQVVLLGLHGPIWTSLVARRTGKRRGCGRSQK